MQTLLNYPLVLSLVSLVVLGICAWFGAVHLSRFTRRGELARDDLSVVLGATLTLLGLIIGFSFSMSISRYDQRKNYEEAEANAIGTEYLRADLLPAEDAARIRTLLRRYLDERVVFYSDRDRSRLPQITAQTSELQAALWASVRGVAGGNPTPIMALVVAGMNDVLNAQGYAQAAWWNRIPQAAWTLMMAIAMLSNLMLGFAARHLESRMPLLGVLPLVISIAFLLIADIDSPRGGVIHVSPQNLTALAGSLR